MCRSQVIATCSATGISRIVAPAGQIRLTGHAIVNDSGNPDPIFRNALQQAVQELPEETLVFLLGSRYCETDHLSDIAWNLFGGSPVGWGRVQAICDFVHNHLQFGYEHARPTKTAWEAYHERTGVCRDFAHLAVTLCRCMNIPARYCTGYLGDIGVPAMDAPMDFSGWFEAYLGGQWHVFDARFNTSTDRTSIDCSRSRCRRCGDCDNLWTKHVGGLSGYCR